jgi:6-phosphofructo-2-kinase/fructose-2,6-biphosphatase 2
MELARPSKRTNGAGVQVEDTQICVVMVGLPARGKSLIAQKGTDYSMEFSSCWQDLC